MLRTRFTDELTEADAHAIAEAARPLLADVPAPTLVFHRPTIRSEAIALTPRPANAIRRIRRRIRRPG